MRLARRIICAGLSVRLGQIVGVASRRRGERADRLSSSQTGSGRWSRPMSRSLQTATRSAESCSGRATPRAPRREPRPRSRRPKLRIRSFPIQWLRQVWPIGILAGFCAPTVGGRQFLAVARDAERPKEALKAARQTRSARSDCSWRCPPRNPVGPENAPNFKEFKETDIHSRRRL
jgi:hypothetical protein